MVTPTFKHNLGVCALQVVVDQHRTSSNRIEDVAITTMTAPQDNRAEGISHSDFAKSELAKLGYGSSGEVVPAGPLLADPDYVLDVALGEDLEPEVLEGLAWVVRNHRIDWPYQFWLASHFGHADRLDQVLTKAGLTHLRDQQSTCDETTVDFLATLSSMLTSSQE